MFTLHPCPSHVVTTPLLWSTVYQLSPFYDLFAMPTHPAGHWPEQAACGRLYLLCGFPQLTNTCKSIHTILKVKIKFNPIRVNLYSEANAQQKAVLNSPFVFKTWKCLLDN